MEPLPYLRLARDTIRELEPELWSWFSSEPYHAQAVEEVKLGLLRSAYRLDPVTHERLYGVAESVKASLALELPLTLYQAQGTSERNAGIHYLPGELHVVLQGELSRLLDDRELTALFGHELSHYRLWTAENGDYLVTDRLLSTMANDPRAENSHVETARRYRQYTEIYADRGALAACGDLDAVVSSLVKVGTGLAEVSAEQYLLQAEEIVARSVSSSGSATHPEAFVRALAASAWVRTPEAADERIRGMIEGEPALERLDLPGQVAATQSSRRLVQRLLEPEWFRTEPVLALAALYFSDFSPDAPNGHAVEPVAAGLASYFAYVLFDFARVDPAIEDEALARALGIAADIGLEERFTELLGKEMRMKRSALQKLRDRAAAAGA